MVNFLSHFFTTDYTDSTDADYVKTHAETEGRQRYQGGKGIFLGVSLSDLDDFGIGRPDRFHGRSSARIFGSVFL